MNYMFDYYNNNNESDTDTEISSEYSLDADEPNDYDNDNLNFICKNVDPFLAKLMGIIIEEEKNHTDWKPPTTHGLDNSKEIIHQNYFHNRTMLEHIDLFDVIKNDIANFRKLSQEKLDYIKNLNHDEKCEIIMIYNEILEKTRK